MPDFTEPSAIREACVGARARIIDLVRADDGERWKISAPSCPGWTAHDVLAHLAANTTQALAGRISGPPSEEMTAIQVADRRQVPTAAVADEWEWNTAIDDVIDSMGMAVFRIAMDAITHEGDIRGALAESRPHLGRRSASRVREFDWSGDPTPYVDIFGAFDLASSPMVD